MAFIKSNLREEFEKFADATSPNFIESPQSKEDAAEYWANALDIYGSTVTPVSTNVAAAHLAFVNLFNTMTVLTGAVIFPTCFTAYGSALASGMSPAFIGTPPPNPPIFTSVQAAAVAGANQTQCLDLIVDIIDIWFKSGTATPSGGGSTINWS